MTLTQFKAMLAVGTVWQCVSFNGNPPNERMNMPRKIIKVNTTGVKFDTGSWIYWPKASELIITDSGFITDKPHAKIEYVRT